jgi:hypothetical protein
VSQIRNLTVLCLQQIRQRDARSTSHALPRASTRSVHIRQKIGPLWKLMYIIEPAPQPNRTLMLRDEKNELVVFDGPFAETKF